MQSLIALGAVAALIILVVVVVALVVYEPLAGVLVLLVLVFVGITCRSKNPQDQGEWQDPKT